ncbi:MAG TPA: hypothetical protein VKI43_10595, partial [Vicinamibacterales bacterium]|nr:hypothetical protein [Vicinamibacterales bacterium]
MQDDFDNRMGLPDDELPGGSAMSDMGESAEHAETDMDHVGSAPAGRPSGGARARKSTAAPKPSAAPKAASAPKPVARKSAGG